MWFRTKLKAYTINEMLVVLVITIIVVGMAFSILTLVQKHMNMIRKSFNNNMEFEKLEFSLVLDFYKFSSIDYDDTNNVLSFYNSLDTVKYIFEDDKIYKEIDTFFIELKEKKIFFGGEEILQGNLDAIKIKTTEKNRSHSLFLYKKNAASQFIINQ